MNALALVLMFGALVLTAVEAIRARNLGWAGAGLFVLAVIVQSGALAITDD